VVDKVQFSCVVGEKAGCSRLGVSTNTLWKLRVYWNQPRNVVSFQPCVLLFIYFVVRAHENLFEGCLLYFCKLLCVMQWLSLKYKSSGCLQRLWDYWDTHRETIVSYWRKLEKSFLEYLFFLQKKKASTTLFI